MNHFHAVVWLDHAVARIFHFDAHAYESKIVHSAHAGEHLHHKSGSVGPGHAADDPKFFAAVADALKDAQEILVTGPGGTKGALMKHLEKHAAALAKRVVAVENADHPTDGEIVGSARKHFKVIDRMTPQRA
ncbi:MAG: translational machinery protein [Alphaproteobacteria bacterium]|nr:translational machinery protein [Alphaproteobacteria bacterium]